MDSIVFIILGIIGCIYIGARASEMGYSGLLWFLVSFLNSPILTMSFLSVLSNRTLYQKREAYKKQIELRLDKQEARKRSLEGKVDINDITISDLETML